MQVKVRVFGLLGQLLKKNIPREVNLCPAAPVTVRDVLFEIGIDNSDLQWIAVGINGKIATQDVFDRRLDMEQVEIAVYPVFAGG